MEEEKKRVSKEELAEKEKEALFIVKQDLSKWLSRLLGIPIQPETFLSQLDTGVLLCQIVALIQEQAAKEENKKSSKANQRNVPLREIQCNKKAKQESFHARDNTANFISWCREANIEEAVMFESNGLVQHEDERRVILCLLEVARIAGQLGMATPELVEFEKEIDSLEEQDQEGGGGGGGDKRPALGDQVGREEKRKDGEPPKEKRRRRRDSLDNKVTLHPVLH